ncbi:hypothetical protein FRB97_008977 [Tulasnella sp. 331]|nr:hypothetical protein FRB97_008977 [Tulasnella sp. 331]
MSRSALTVIVLLVLSVVTWSFPTPGKAPRASTPSVTGGILTYYYPTGQESNVKDAFGACGTKNLNTDNVVAVSSEMFDSGAMCHASITISHGGKSLSVTVMDLCEDCDRKHIDASPKVFGYFADLSVGVIEQGA